MVTSSDLSAENSQIWAAAMQQSRLMSTSFRDVSSCQWISTSCHLNPVALEQITFITTVYQVETQVTKWNQKPACSSLDTTTYSKQSSLRWYLRTWKCAPPRLSEVSPKWCLWNSSSNWWWHSLVLSRKSIQHFLFPYLSPPGNQWCNILSFVPACRVSSSSTLQVFQGTSHLYWLLYL